MANPWLSRRVLLYAHQGGAREAPSSTLHALHRAVGLGAHALELDVHATADGHLVVCHDETVDRTTPATGFIADLTLAELRRLDNAHWWVPGHDALPGRPDHEYPLRGRHPDDPALGIATLDEVLEAFPTTFLNFDIKRTAPDVAPYEEALARALRRHGRVDDVIVASFHDGALAAFRAADPEIHTSLGPLETLMVGQAIVGGAADAPTPRSAVALQVPVSYGDIRIVDRHFVDGAHALGLAVHVWTIDEVAEMHELLDLGVDGIMTDVPSVLAGVLAERGSAWR